jgi:glycosyltransferase involved in cell wall biosynthesis
MQSLMNLSALKQKNGHRAVLVQNAMRIAIVTNKFLPKWMGGTEVATLNMAHCLAALGHDVHIVTSRDEGMPPESADSGIQVHRVYTPGLKSVGAGVFYLAVIHALSRVNPQIIHVQDFLLGPCGFFAKRLLKRPYVVWGRGYEFRDLTFRTAVVLKDAEAVIALTDDMRNELQRICSREICVISNGIDTERFERVSREDARRQLGIEPTQKIVLYVGRFYPVKGVKYLITAMQRILHEEENAKLMLVGYGSEEGNLKLLVKESGLSDCVSFVGAVPNDMIPAYMVASDVLVLPSLSEGFPMVSLEAMAASLPIVATNVGGIPSIVEEGINGFLVKPRDAAQIADKVSSILCDPELSHFISTNNKSKAQLYTWDRVVHDLEDVYLKCVAGT